MWGKLCCSSGHKLQSAGRSRAVDSNMGCRGRGYDGAEPATVCLYTESRAGGSCGTQAPCVLRTQDPPPPRLPPAPPRSTHIPGCWRQLLPEGFPVFKDTDFVFYRPVSGLRANLGRRPIYPIFLVFLLRPLGTWRKSTTPFEGKSADEMIQSQLTGFERLSLG